MAITCLSYTSICAAQQPTPPAWLNPNGMTVETRFVPPQGFSRINYNDPYSDYMRKLPMLPDGSPILLYTGQLKAHEIYNNVPMLPKELEQISYIKHNNLIKLSIIMSTVWNFPGICINRDTAPHLKAEKPLW